MTENNKRVLDSKLGQTDQEWRTRNRNDEMQIDEGPLGGSTTPGRGLVMGPSTALLLPEHTCQAREKQAGQQREKIKRLGSDWLEVGHSENCRALIFWES